MQSVHSSINYSKWDKLAVDSSDDDYDEGGANDANLVDSYEGSDVDSSGSSLGAASDGEPETLGDPPAAAAAAAGVALPPGDVLDQRRWKALAASMAEGLLEDFMRSSSWAGDASVSSTTTTTTTTNIHGGKQATSEKKQTKPSLSTDTSTNGRVPPANAKTSSATPSTASADVRPQIQTKPISYEKWDRLCTDSSSEDDGYSGDDADARPVHPWDVIGKTLSSVAAAAPPQPPPPLSSSSSSNLGADANACGDHATIADANLQRAIADHDGDDNCTRARFYACPTHQVPCILQRARHSLRAWLAPDVSEAGTREMLSSLSDAEAPKFANHCLCDWCRAELVVNCAMGHAAASLPELAYSAAAESEGFPWECDDARKASLDVALVACAAACGAGSPSCGPPQCRARAFFSMGAEADGCCIALTNVLAQGDVAARCRSAEVASYRHRGRPCHSVNAGVSLASRLLTLFPNDGMIGAPETMRIADATPPLVFYPLGVSAAAGQPSVALLLLEQGCNPLCPACVDLRADADLQPIGYALPPLFYAARRGGGWLIEEMVRAGCWDDVLWLPLALEGHPEDHAAAMELALSPERARARCVGDTSASPSVLMRCLSYLAMPLLRDASDDVYEISDVWRWLRCEQGRQEDIVTHVAGRFGLNVLFRPEKCADELLRTLPRCVGSTNSGGDGGSSSKTGAKLDVGRATAASLVLLVAIAELRFFDAWDAHSKAHGLPSLSGYGCEMEGRMSPMLSTFELGYVAAQLGWGLGDAPMLWDLLQCVAMLPPHGVESKASSSSSKKDGKKDSAKGASSTVSSAPQTVLSKLIAFRLRPDGDYFEPGQEARHVVSMPVAALRALCSCRGLSGPFLEKRDMAAALRAQKGAEAANCLAETFHATPTARRLQFVRRVLLMTGAFGTGLEQQSLSPSSKCEGGDLPGLGDLPPYAGLLGESDDAHDAVGTAPPPLPEIACLSTHGAITSCVETLGTYQRRIFRRCRGLERSKLALAGRCLYDTSFMGHEVPLSRFGTATTPAMSPQSLNGAAGNGAKVATATAVPPPAANGGVSSAARASAPAPSDSSTSSAAAASGGLAVVVSVTCSYGTRCFKVWADDPISRVTVAWNDRARREGWLDDHKSHTFMCSGRPLAPEAGATARSLGAIRKGSPAPLNANGSSLELSVVFDDPKAERLAVESLAAAIEGGIDPSAFDEDAERKKRKAERRKARKAEAKAEAREQEEQERLQREKEEQERERKAAEEAEQERRRKAVEEEKRKAEEEERRRKAAAEEEKRRKAEEIKKLKKAAEEEKKRRKAEFEAEKKRRKAAAAEEEKKRKAAAAEEEKKRKAAAAEEEKRRKAAAAEEDKRRKAAAAAAAAAAEEERKRKEAEDRKRKAAAAEEDRKRKAAEVEAERRARLANRRAATSMGSAPMPDAMPTRHAHVAPSAAALPAHGAHMAHARMPPSQMWHAHSPASHAPPVQMAPRQVWRSRQVTQPAPPPSAPPPIPPPPVNVPMAYNMPPAPQSQPQPHPQPLPQPQPQPTQPPQSQPGSIWGWGWGGAATAPAPATTVHHTMAVPAAPPATAPEVSDTPQGLSLDFLD